MHYPLRLPTFSEEQFSVFMCLPERDSVLILLNNNEYLHSIDCTCCISYHFVDLLSPYSPPFLNIKKLSFDSAFPWSSSFNTMSFGQPVIHPQVTDEVNRQILKPCQAKQSGPSQVPSALPWEVGIQCHELWESLTKTENAIQSSWLQNTFQTLKHQ